MERVALPINRYPGERNPYPSNSSRLRSWKSKGNQKSWSMVPPRRAWSWSRRPEFSWWNERNADPGHEVEKKEVAWKGGALEVERFLISKFRIKMDLISSLLFALQNFSFYLSVKTEFRIWQLLMEFLPSFLKWQNSLFISGIYFRYDGIDIAVKSFFFYCLLSSDSLRILHSLGSFQILNQNWSIEVLKLEVEAWVQS